MTWTASAHHDGREVASPTSHGFGGAEWVGESVRAVKGVPGCLSGGGGPGVREEVSGRWNGNGSGNEKANGSGRSDGGCGEGREILTGVDDLGRLEEGSRHGGEGDFGSCFACHHRLGRALLVDPYPCGRRAQVGEAYDLYVSYHPARAPSVLCLLLSDATCLAPSSQLPIWLFAPEF